ncbi:hypothetical protein TM7_0055 [candidate division TM7 genomosp. GTL1]|nr:hypothetical protein TM7_0055 [candidate division TM7 genomosp. GTL1]
MLGWLFCPLAELARNISETVAGTVEGLLYVEPLTLSTNSPIYITWTLVRDIANITLVILFLIIIFSQATSRGISNYGIKRILPRLIIMAVLINISYYVCAFAIDIANLIGAGVKGFIQVGLDAAPKPNLGEDEWDGSYKGLIVGLFATFLTLALLGPIWAVLAFVFSAIAMAVLTGFVMLIFRQLMIVLLVIISPLAFAAALLPNTSEWFSRWRKTFTTMLLSYPIVMFLFYGATLVAVILGVVLLPPK